MNGKMKTVLALGLALLLLVSGSALVGCGKGTPAGKTTIRIAMLTDYTGPGSNTLRPVLESMRDYFRMLDEVQPIPGVAVEFINYDTRSDASRSPGGYVWLKTQNPAILVAPSPVDAELLGDKFPEDKLACFSTIGSIPLRDSGNQWYFAWSYPYDDEGQVISQWIVDNWDYTGTGRNPVVGRIGPTGMAQVFATEAGINRWVEHNPGRIDFPAVDAVVIGTTTWAADVERLKNCDYIWTTLPSTMLVSFSKEVLLRGYTGQLVSGTSGFAANWPAVKAAIPSGPGAYNKIHYWSSLVPWSEDIPFNLMVKEYSIKYHGLDPAMTAAPMSPQCGFAYATVIGEAIRKAVAAVGAENVDTTAIRDALAKTDITVEGYGNKWAYSAPAKRLWCSYTMRAYGWSEAKEDWVAIGDWTEAPY